MLAAAIYGGSFNKSFGVTLNFFTNRESTIESGEKSDNSLVVLVSCVTNEDASRKCFGFFFGVKQVYAAGAGGSGTAAAVVGPELLAHQSLPCLLLQQQMLLVLITHYSGNVHS